ncbi:Purple acid phosphatase 21 [Diplonema papillatum]|nr:Purple acid phosphatase 21 [Diplonema papillatum]
MEETLLTFGVDIVVAGHTRHYERSYHVARGAVTSQHYHNPTAPVHIQSGIAGGGNALVTGQRPAPRLRRNDLRPP